MCHASSSHPARVVVRRLCRSDRALGLTTVSARVPLALPGDAGRTERARARIRHHGADREGRWHVEGLIGGIEYQVRAAPNEKRLGSMLTRFTAKPGETVDLGQMVLEE